MTGTPRSRARPTLEQVARAAGVSRATVSRVVNGVESVDPGIRSAVEQAITSVIFEPELVIRESA